MFKALGMSLVVAFVLTMWRRLRLAARLGISSEGATWVSGIGVTRASVPTSR